VTPPDTEQKQIQKRSEKKERKLNNNLKTSIREWELKNGKLETKDFSTVCKKYDLYPSELPILINEFRASCLEKPYEYSHFDLAFTRWNWEKQADFIKRKRKQSPSYLL
jgi:hypothetical protein